VSEPGARRSCSRHARDRVSSAPVRRHLRNSRGTDSCLANPPRSAKLAERTLSFVPAPAYHNNAKAATHHRARCFRTNRRGAPAARTTSCASFDSAHWRDGVEVVASAAETARRHAKGNARQATAPSAAGFPWRRVRLTREGQALLDN